MASNKGYAAYANNKITTASPAELTLMLYEGAIKFTNMAIVAIEKNDIEEYIIHCVNYLEIDHHLLVVAMMTLDKILKNNFVLTEKNVHK